MNCIQCVNIKKDSTCIACKLYPHWHRIFLLTQENRRRRIERKRLNGKSYVVLIGVENQSDIHYSIPVKNMFYDVMAYGNQVKETAKKHRKEKDTATSDEFLSGFTKTDKLIPVITITVYLGIKEWDGPRKLSDMFGDVDEELLPFIPDYRINLLAPREITDFTGFRTSIRQLFEVLQNAYDKEKMQEVLQNDEKFSKVDRETVEAINLFAGTDIDIDEKEEVIDMCKAWEDQKNEGRKLGREEGRIRQAKVTALKLQKKGYSIEDIAECVDFDEETVKKWLVS
ncbi:MAG: Rpn family recombination-promoting nuclease/putative transposase [Agathobacter sp.]|uniref:Rpn family recombination-promoting nuclease/putative transposase n=1 Tax=Agathobacter sp. TaxID=2021311 RepID=UPI002E7A4448|nr:Rpn family recombination-promoting nuclease/putative transposase [Agathobacter sp.]MEE1217153.1 Rpn family recombination-promoting nuclease/putative transposase [Agathobacter sp.]